MFKWRRRLTKKAKRNCFFPFLYARSFILQTVNNSSCYQSLRTHVLLLFRSQVGIALARVCKQYDMTQGPGPFALEHDERFGTITGSVVRLVTDRRDLEALLSIFQLKHWDKNAEELFRRGHEEEERTAVFYANEREQREGEKVTLLHPRFCRHPKFPFLGCTGDRKVLGKNQGVQLKFRAGAKSSEPVELHKAGCTKGASCECQSRCEYIDQCCLEMMVYGWERNDLAVRSDVGGDYMRIDRTCLDIWLPIAWPILNEFYDKYLRWYWTDDHRPEATASLREALTEFLARPENADRKVDLETKVFRRRPLDFKDIKIAQDMQPSTKRKFEEEDPVEKPLSSDDLPMHLIDRVSFFAGTDVAESLSKNARYWEELGSTKMNLLNFSPGPMWVVSAAKALSGDEGSPKTEAEFVTRLLDSQTDKKMIALALARKVPLPFCVHGRVIQASSAAFLEKCRLTSCACDKKGTSTCPVGSSSS